MRAALDGLASIRMADEPEQENGQVGDDRALTLQAAGITLLGVLVSIGVTVGFGLTAAWWVRLLAGAGTTVAMAVLIAVLGTRTSLLARLANWITGRSYRS